MVSITIPDNAEITNIRTGWSGGDTKEECGNCETTVRISYET
jgi:hypothetical protein